MLDEDAQPLADRLLVGCCVVIQAAQECACRHHPRAALSECVCSCSMLRQHGSRHRKCAVARQCSWLHSSNYCWKVCDKCHFVP